MWQAWRMVAMVVLHQCLPLMGIWRFKLVQKLDGEHQTWHLQIGMCKCHRIQWLCGSVYHYYSNPLVFFLTKDPWVCFKPQILSEFWALPYHHIGTPTGTWNDEANWLSSSDRGKNCEVFFWTFTIIDPRLVNLCQSLHFSHISSFFCGFLVGTGGLYHEKIMVFLMVNLFIFSAEKSDTILWLHTWKSIQTFILFEGCYKNHYYWF